MTKNVAGKMWHVKSKFLPFFWHLGAFWQLLRNVHKISLSMHSIQNAAQKCPVIIWVYIDVKNWSPKDVTCHVISSVKSCVPKTVRVKSNLMHSVRNAAQKCPVIIWVCIDDKKWSRKDVTCHVHYFYPSFFVASWEFVQEFWANMASSYYCCAKA